MKKLMTMLAAAATAFGLYAADPVFVSGTSFNELQIGTFTGEGGTPEVWSGFAEDNKNEIVDATWTETPGVGVPMQFAESGAVKCLKVDTTLGHPIARSCGNAILGDVYVDLMAEFTVFDVDDTPAADATAKVAIYLQETAAGKTNVFVRAGKYVADKIESYDYDCGDVSGYKLTDWNRVTVKSIADITASSEKQGFVVFINQNALKTTEATGATGLTAKANAWAKEGMLFPSIGTVSSVTAVAFDGKGQVDDIAFDERLPFAKAADTSFFTASWPAANVTAVTINGKPVENVAAGSLEVELPDGGSVTIAWTGTDGYIDGSKTFTGVADGGTTALTITDVLPAVAMFNTTKYAALADAVAYANTNGTAGTVKLIADNITYDIVISKAETILDLNGKRLTGDISGAIVLTNGDTANAAIVDGYVADATGQINVTNIKFDYEENEDELNPGTCAIQLVCTGAAEGYQFVQGTGADAVYWVLAKQDFSGGSGTEDDPYIIAKAADLVELAEKSVGGDAAQYLSACYTQTANIELTAAFDGIGARDMKDTLGSNLAGYTSANVFKGTYDGNDCTVSGLILNAGDYIGFFNSCYGATIKNLKISLGNTTGWSDVTGDQVGAVFVGVSLNTTIENCQTVKLDGKDTFKASKTAAGFVGFAANGTTISNCVNNLNIWSVSNDKAGGFVACAQAGKSTGDGIVIDGCSNLGVVQNGGANPYIGGLVGYSDLKVTFKGANTVEGIITPNSGYAKSLLHVQGGSVVVANGAIFTVPADYKTVTDDKAVDGLFFATVDNGVATLVKNAALAAGGTYKVMAAGAAPVIKLEKDQSITFDQSLATIDPTDITCPNGYKIEPTGSGTITYAPAIQNYTITYAYTTNGTSVAASEIAVVNENPTTFTVENTIVIDAAKISLAGYTVKSVSSAGWAAGEKYADETVNVAFELAAAPIPPVIDQGSPEQKEAYGNWASKQAGTSFNPADPANVDRFILDMPATATDKQLEEKLASIITADMLNQILAKGFDKVDFSALADTYPNAHFEFVVAPEIKAEEGVSGFYRLTAKFVPAN